MSSSRSNLPPWSLFLIGVVLGVVAEAAFQPNHIKFVVLSSGEVYLYPSKGDVIEWFAKDNNPSTLAKVRAKFDYGENGPCIEGADTTRCTIKSKAMPGLYFYKCKNSADGDLCGDPGIDPNSSTDGESFYVFKKTYLNIASTFKEVTSITGKPDPAGTYTKTLVGLTKEFSLASGGGGAKEKGIITPNPTNLVIRCNSGNQTEVIVPGNNSGDFPVVQTDYVLQWNGGPYAYDITIPAGTCAGDPKISTDPGATTSCRITAGNGDVPYTVTTKTQSGSAPACGTASGPAHFLVQNPAPPAP